MLFAPCEYYFPSVFPLMVSDDEIKKFIFKIYDKRFGTKRKVKIYGKYSNVEAAKNEIEKCIAQ